LLVYLQRKEDVGRSNKISFKLTVLRKQT
jgi:hypothetical protein